MLDAARENEGSGVERIAKLQEEKKILQVLCFCSCTFLNQVLPGTSNRTSTSHCTA